MDRLAVCDIGCQSLHQLTDIIIVTSSYDKPISATVWQTRSRLSGLEFGEGSSVVIN